MWDILLVPSGGPSGTVDANASRLSAGVIAIGTGAAGSKAGNLALTPGSTVTSDVNVCWQSGNALTQGSVCGTSLRKYKKNIHPLSHGLADIMQMKPVRFDWKSTGETEIGMIADDVAKIDPLAGAYNKDGQLYNFKDRAVLATLVKAVQEQQSEIESLKKELARRK